MMLSPDDLTVLRRLCLRRIESAVASVFADIEHVVSEFERLWHKKAICGLTPVSVDLKLLRAVADRLLTGDNRWMLGAGVVLEPGVLADCDMYSEWRHLVAEGRPAQLDLNFNRSSTNYYNYREMPWFTRPRDTGGRAVEGPYIDLYGQDAYILTFTHPLQLKGDFIGIAGADVDLGRFERALVPTLLAFNHEALLLSQTGRVVASNTPSWLPGERGPDLASDEVIATALSTLNAHWTLVEYASAVAV